MESSERFHSPSDLLHGQCRPCDVLVVVVVLLDEPLRGAPSLFGLNSVLAYTARHVTLVLNICDIVREIHATLTPSPHGP